MPDISIEVTPDNKVIVTESKPTPEPDVKETDLDTLIAKRKELILRNNDLTKSFNEAIIENDLMAEKNENLISLAILQGAKTRDEFIGDKGTIKINK